MNNLLLSVAIGDISGSLYEHRAHQTKNYNDVVVMHEMGKYTDDTVCTYACAEALLKHIDIATNLVLRCRQHSNAGFGSRFLEWMEGDDHTPYGSLGNGSAMRCSSAGWISQTEEQTVKLATELSAPTHNHPDGIKGAVATALSIYHLKNGKDKDFVRNEILGRYYPDWKYLRYKDFHDEYVFDVTCEGTVPPAIICFLDSSDYIDSIKLAISLGGDADTLAAIVGPISYAFYKEIPQLLIETARGLLPQWMLEINDEFDRTVNSSK